MTGLDELLARPGEPLTQHVREVLARLNELEANRSLPEYPHLFRRLRLTALLHDSGKLAQGFQKQLTQSGFRWGLRHEVLSLAFVPWLDCLPEDRLWVVLITATHHRGLDFILDTYRQGTRRVELLMEDVADQTCADWYEWLQTQDVPLLPYRIPRAPDLYGMLTLLNDWQAAQPQPFSDNPAYVELLLAHGLFTQADHSAAAGIALYPPQAPRLETLLDGRSLYRHQQQCADHAGQSLILTAPAGSGKTLAALLWARHAAGQVVYLLPYRASMNAMHSQLQSVFAHIGIQHGRALNVLYRQALQSDQNEKQAIQTARLHLNQARLNAYPARVTSPHVLLRAMYGLSGYTAAQAMLYGAALIVDEFHAYQPERLAKILAMLAFFQHRLNIRLLLMTATLPGVMQTALVEVFGNLPQISADETVYRQFMRHRIQVEPGDLAEQLEVIVAQAQAGQAVLITVNTVRRARRIAHLIRTLHHYDVLLLHGRFNGRDRWRHEQQILALFSLNGSRSTNPIVVSTQVIEVSLNLDFDTIHSDPAPLDALLQRFGRVNRAGRLGTLAPVQIYSQPDGSEDRLPVYDPELIRRTLELLRSHQGEAVDEALVPRWLDNVYSDTAGWLERFRHARQEFEEVILADLNPFEPAGEWLARAFRRLFDEVYVLPLDLEEDYLRLVRSNPIEASDLLVSISWGQYKMLERRQQAWEGDSGYFVDCPYDPRLGLLLNEDEEE